MNIYDYYFSTNKEKEQWLENLSIISGLKYFGGKAKIGKYILNHIFNMAIDMKTKEENQNKPFVFIDAFCGGGKIGLSIPTGFFDYVVINDLDWGVYNYFKYVKENPELLIKTIEVIGQEFDEEKFFLFAKIRDDQRLDGLLAGALTWWTTYSSFNGMTDFDKISYALPYKVDNSKMILKEEDVKRTYEKNQYIEHEAIEKSMALARKKIPVLSKKMSRGNYIVENMDYKELIKKYNGKNYSATSNTDEEKCDIPEGAVKLWYFDVPYHPYTLSAGNPAPYTHTFTPDQAKEAVEIFSGQKEKDYGSIEYFLKSDYSLEDAVLMIKDLQKKGKASKEQLQILALDNKNPNDVSKAFAPLEDEGKGFLKISLGGFDKGAISEGEKTVGYEYLWTHGFTDDTIKRIKKQVR